MGNKAVPRSAMLLIGTLVSITGCTSLCDCKYELTQKIRTTKAWHEYDCDRCITSDYKSGWKAGYYDVITGGTGCPPVVAPSRYWTPPVFTQYDPGRRDDWYTGFQDGVACARCEPELHYLQTFQPRSVQHVHAASVTHEQPAHVPAVPDEAPISKSEATDIPELPMPMPMPMPMPNPDPNPSPANADPSAQAPETKKPASDYDPEPVPQDQSEKSVGVSFRTRPIRIRPAAPQGQRSLLEELIANSSSGQSR